MMIENNVVYIVIENNVVYIMMENNDFISGVIR